MTTVFNRSEQKEQRRALRKAMPLAEQILWRHLRGKNALGFKFRRQYGVEKFIIDFYCAQAKLAIEIDGESHYAAVDAAQYDAMRQQVIEQYGIRFLRVTNEDIYHNLDGVLHAIAAELNRLTSPTPPW